MEFKQCELNNEYSWLTCFLIINLDLPTTDKVMKFLTHNRHLDTPHPPPPIQTLFLHKAKQGRWLCAVATQLTKFSRIKELRTDSSWKRQIL